MLSYFIGPCIFSLASLPSYLSSLLPFLNKKKNTSKLDGNDPTTLSHHPYILCHFANYAHHKTLQLKPQHTIQTQCCSCTPQFLYTGKTDHFRCYEAKIEESEKASSCRELNLGHLWLEPPVLRFYFCLITSKFIYFQRETRCSEQDRPYLPRSV